MPVFFVSTARGGREGKQVRAGTSALEALRGLGVTQPVRVQRRRGNVWVPIDVGYVIKQADTLRAVPLGGTQTSSGARFASWLERLLSTLKRKKNT